MAAAQAKAPAKKSSSASNAAKAPAKTTSQRNSSTRRRARRSSRQQTPSADRIREIQEALAREGHYKGEPTGKWDAATTEAMKSFQKANDLNPTGKLDARSLQKLGLGSEVAGVAPPRPVPTAEP